MLNTKILLRDDYERGYDRGQEAHRDADSYGFCRRAVALEDEQDRSDLGEADLAFVVGCFDAIDGAPREASELVLRMQMFTEGS